MEKKEKTKAGKNPKISKKFEEIDDLVYVKSFELEKVYKIIGTNIGFGLTESFYNHEGDELGYYDLEPTSMYWALLKFRIKNDGNYEFVEDLSGWMYSKTMANKALAEYKKRIKKGQY